MDTTHLDDLAGELAAADPADAPDHADELAARLAGELETADPEREEDGGEGAA